MNLISMLFWAVMALACNPSSVEEGFYNEQTVIVDVGNPITLKLSQLVDTLRIVPLETKDHFIGEASQVVWGEDNLYVVDKRKAKAIFIYDHEGKFIREIDAQGIGPGQYKSLNRVQIMEERDRIYIFDGGQLKFLEIDLEGNFIREKKLAADFRFRDFFIDGDKMYIKKGFEGDWNDRVGITDVALSSYIPLNSYIKGELKADLGGDHFHPSYNNEGLYFTSPENPYIRKYNADTLEKVLKFKFTSNNMDYNPEKEYSVVEARELKNRREVYFLGSSLKDCSNYLFIDCVFSARGENGGFVSTIVYHKQSHSAKLVDDIINDVDHRYLIFPTVSSRTNTNKMIMPIPAPLFLIDREKGYWKDGSYRDIINSIERDKMDNHVLFIYDLKEEIDLE